ncbi:hypothetical protein MLD38_037843 [Melastoma candidum]|uniref:Uncharacterized protein n=1 Tax=Melastoma candidum TaxID=119954 RepID=A0ACB9LNA5_9MYRT|nr:hypothetical protein MLD38_037843 [Melastoma candidum]
MTCFGVIVSPGRAYTLPTAPGAAGRLHLTQVSLDDGSDDRTVTVRVTLGEKVPIIIARLLPRHSESLHLDLRYNLSQEVTFSILGPRKVHLAGYFDGLPDSADSESFGEDIGQSDSYQKSGGDSEYGGSFINDSDPGYSSPSADSTFKANGLPDDKKTMPKEKKSNRRQLRKVHVVESNTDSSETSGGSGTVSVVPDSDDDFEFFGDSLLKRKLRENCSGEGSVQRIISTTQKLTRSSERGNEMAEKSVPDSKGSTVSSPPKQSAKLKDSKKGSTNANSRTPLKNGTIGGVIGPIVVENDLEAGKAASPRPMKAETASESLAKKKKKCVKKLDPNWNNDNEQSLEVVSPEPVTLHSPKNSEEVDLGLKVTKKKKKQLKDELGGTGEPTKEQVTRAPNALDNEKQLAGLKCLAAIKPEPVTLHSPKDSEEVDLGLKVMKKKKQVKGELGGTGEPTKEQASRAPNALDKENQLAGVKCLNAGEPDDDSVLQFNESVKDDGLRSKKGKRKKYEENDAVATQPSIPLSTPTQSMPAKTEDESNKEKKKKKKQREN